MRISDLPDDCVRQILSRFTDHKDIVNTGLTEARTFELSKEHSLWKDLCLFHFDNIQILSLTKIGTDLQTYTAADWKALYSRLVK